jgi:hypothetical protein
LFFNYQASNPAISQLLALVGVDVSSVTGLVGANCSPISVIGAGGNQCKQAPVCCENNNFVRVFAKLIKRVASTDEYIL